MNELRLGVAADTPTEEIRSLLVNGARSVTRPVSSRMEEVFVMHEGRLWELTNCHKAGGWTQVNETCIDQEYDEEGNELH